MQYVKKNNFEWTKFIDGTALKNDKLYLQENFWSDGIKSACIHHPQPAWQAC